MSGYSDPGYLRHCMRPGCDARFNVVTGEGLGEQPTGWRQLTLVVPGYLCPVHAPAVTSGAHRPRWLNPDAEPRGLCGIGCSCGWSWTPGEPSTAGAHGDRWRGHLPGAVPDRGGAS